MKTLVGAYKNLNVWTKSYELTLKVYDATRSYPKDEMYGLRSQMRRAAASIPSNIAEGYGRRGLKEYIRFVSISIGSCNELEVYLLLSNDLKLLENKQSKTLSSTRDEISRMLFSLRKALQRKKEAEG